MNTSASLWSLALACAHLVSVATGAAAQEAPPASVQEHSIERLYSLPSLIGTAPTGFSWSPDSRSLAFLWNDAGFPLRDVWVLDLADPNRTARRITQVDDLVTTRKSTPTHEPEDSLAAAEAQEIFEQDWGVDEVTWTPDGKQLIFAFGGDLWSVSPGTERGELPRWLTRSEAVETAASVSPDGSALAYLAGGELWTIPLGEAPPGPPRRRVAAQAGTQTGTQTGTQAGVETGTKTASMAGRNESLPLDTSIRSFRWSSTGSHIAVLHEDRTSVTARGIPDYLTEETTLRMIRRAYPGEAAVQHRLAVISLEDGSTDWIEWPAGAPDRLLSYRWSPDARRLAVDTSDLYAKDRRLFVIDLKAGRPELPRQVFRDHDPLNETFYFWRIEWAVDSSVIYLLSDRSEDYHLYSVSPEGGAPAQLTRGPWAVASMTPVEGGVVAVGNRGRAEQRQLFRVSDTNPEPVQLSRRPGTHSPVVSPNGQWAAVAFSSDDNPPDLFLTRLDGSGQEERITRSPLAEFESYRWVTPQYVEFESHVDGSPLHGRLTLPPNWQPGKTYPAILGSVYTDSVRNQWGGRTAHPTWGLDQFLAQEGYVLLNVDMRGSWGRGRAHRRGIRLDYGGIDIEDLESGVRFLASLGYVDMDRVGIWGSSYGGLMTAMSLFRKPGLYAAGVAGAPATNVWHALTGQMAVMMRPQDQAAEYADSSPFVHSSGLEDPLMIIHGMRDWVVLFKDSVVLTQRLILEGKDVDLVALPNAGHGWDNEGLAQTRYAFGKLIEHFERHLKP